MDSYDVGLKIRTKVLGEAHVQKSLADVDDFNHDLQQIVTGFAWGQIWSRPGLSLRDRSLINLAMLTALNRAPEIKLHVKGALTNGVSVDEIKAVLLHATAYCGIPAGLDAFKAAHEVLVKEGKVPAAKS